MSQKVARQQEIAVVSDLLCLSKHPILLNYAYQKNHTTDQMPAY